MKKSFILCTIFALFFSFTTSAVAQPTPKIIGGSDVEQGKYPFIVSLQDNYGHRCGGSIYNLYDRFQVVLTAGHCVDDLTEDNIDNFKIVANRANLDNQEEGQVRKIGVDSVHIHPRYVNTKEALEYDIALLFLQERIEGIVPVNLPTLGTDALIKPGQEATVAGWGTTSLESSNFPKQLQEVKVPFLSHDECKISYGKLYNKFTNICAGVSGVGICWGDSGGPLFREIEGRIYQVGIVSFGDKCGGQGSPGVYTNLASKQLWDTMFEGSKVSFLSQIVTPDLSAFEVGDATIRATNSTDIKGTELGLKFVAPSGTIFTSHNIGFVTQNGVRLTEIGNLSADKKTLNMSNRSLFSLAPENYIDLTVKLQAEDSNQTGHIDDGSLTITEGNMLEVGGETSLAYNFISKN